MAIFKKTEFQIDHKFDPKSCRHTLNGVNVALHCHHFTSLYTQLADDCSMFDAKKLLAEATEDAFFGMLKNYFETQQICCSRDRISLAEQCYAAVGLGQMKVAFAGPDSGEVELLHSHVDSGWIKKWGKRDTPVNFMTCGYIAGLFSAVFNHPTRSYDVIETQSIVAGAATSRFKVIAR
jgi:hypothetical protein